MEDHIPPRAGYIPGAVPLVLQGLTEIPPESIWVASVYDDAGAYRVGLSLGPGREYFFGLDQARAYGHALLRTCARADFDAATLYQLRHVGIDDHHIADVVREIRDRREKIDDVPFSPFEFRPVVSHLTQRPIVALYLFGKQYAQLDVPEAQRHATQVITVAESAHLDTVYLVYLTGVLELDPARARKLIGNLSRFNPANMETEFLDEK